MVTSAPEEAADGGGERTCVGGWRYADVGLYLVARREAGALCLLGGSRSLLAACRGVVIACEFRVGDGVRLWGSFHDPIRVAARAEAGASLATGAMLIA